MYTHFIQANEPKHLKAKIERFLSTRKKHQHRMSMRKFCRIEYTSDENKVVYMQYKHESSPRGQKSLAIKDD